MKSRDLLVYVAAGAIAGGVIAWTSMRIALAPSVLPVERASLSLNAFNMRLGRPIARYSTNVRKHVDLQILRCIREGGTWFWRAITARNA